MIYYGDHDYTGTFTSQTLRALTNITVNLTCILTNAHLHDYTYLTLPPQEEQLRVALMNYLLKQQPPDHEKTQMVALKFGMFRELAQAREDQAKRDLHRIRPKALGLYISS